MLVQSVGADVQNLDERFLGVFRSADIEGLLFGFGFVLWGLVSLQIRSKTKIQH